MALEDYEQVDLASGNVHRRRGHFLRFLLPGKKPATRTRHCDGDHRGAGGRAGLRAFAGLGSQAQALTVLGYAAYLMQAAFLHGYQYFTSDDKSAQKLWRIVIGTGSFAAMMLFFSIHALVG